MQDDTPFPGLYEDQRRRLVAQDTSDDLPVPPDQIISGLVQAIADFEAYRQAGAFSDYDPDDLADQVFAQLSKTTPSLRETVDDLHPVPVRYPDDEAYQIALMLAVIQRCFVSAVDDPKYSTSEGTKPPRYHDPTLATSELFAATAMSSLTQGGPPNGQDALAAAKHIDDVFRPLVTDHIDHWKQRVLAQAKQEQGLLARIAGEQYDAVEPALRAAGVVPSSFLIELFESNPTNILRFVPTTQVADTDGSNTELDWTPIRKAEQFLRIVNQDLETLRGEWTRLNRIHPLEIIDIAYRLTIDHPPTIEIPGEIDWEGLLTPFTVTEIVNTRELTHGGSRGTTAMLKRVSTDAEEDRRTIQPLVTNISTNRANNRWAFTQYGLAIGYLLQEVDGPVTDPVFDIEEWRTHFHQVIAMTTEPEHHLLYAVSDTFEEYNPGADDTA